MGVLIGIIFLALELDQSTKQASAVAYQQRVNEIDVAQSSLALSKNLAGIYAKLNESNLETLTTTELIQLKASEIAKITRMQGQFYQYQRGFLDNAAYNRIMAAAAGNLNLWRALNIETPFPEFIETIENHDSEVK